MMIERDIRKLMVRHGFPKHPVLRKSSVAQAYAEWCRDDFRLFGTGPSPDVAIEMVYKEARKYVIRKITQGGHE